MNRLVYIVCFMWALAAEASLPSQLPLPPVWKLRGYAYGLDALGQRRSATRDFGLAVTTNAYNYDALGQLKTALGTDPGGVARLNEQFGYAYDAAGNLRHRTNATLTQSFGVNDLNELTTITRTNGLTLSGATPVPATNVWVNWQEAARYADFTWASSNGFALTGSVQTFTNVAEGPYGQRATNLVSVKLPGTVTVVYDANGNLTNDGWRTFEYDAADQLTAVWVTNGWRTEFVYDGLGRKRIERDCVWQGGTWTPTNETRFVYDGMLAIQERDTTNTPQVTYTRGLDLSLSLQGAGGIGGLLGRTDAHGTTYYHADGGGNVTALMDNRGDVVARYLYAPYGNLIGQWGALADANRYRFSSKEWQPSAGLYYYGFRFYEPNSQRWLNQDPIGELGGLNLYGYVYNNPINFVDPFGLDSYAAYTMPVRTAPPGVGGYVDAFGNWSPTFCLSCHENTPTARFYKEQSVLANMLDYKVLAYEQALGFGLTLGFGSLAEQTAAARQADKCRNLTTLYRAVSQAEMEDILKNGFRPGQNSMLAKNFATTREDAAWWGKEFFKLDQKPFFLIQADVRASGLQTAFREPLDFRPAITIPYEGFGNFNSAVNRVQVLPAIPIR